MEDRADDIRAVMDDAGSQRPAILGTSEGGSMAIVFAAAFPDRVHSLLLWGVQRRWLRSADYVWGSSESECLEQLQYVNEHGFDEAFIDGSIGHGDRLPGFREWWSRYVRSSLSPDTYIALEQVNMAVDTTDLLATITVPTLVMVREKDPVASVEAVRDLAQRIPGSKFVVFPGETHSIDDPDPEAVIGAIHDFLQGARLTQYSKRSLATVAFIDIVDSTSVLHSVGDGRWGAVISRFFEIVESQSSPVGGRLVSRAGDGALLTFDGPARAVRALRSIQERALDVGLPTRVGIHTGEVEREGDNLSGLAINLASRICSQARPSELLVSSTVRDLVAGSGLEFADLGMRPLKGIAEPRRLFRAI